LQNLIFGIGSGEFCKNPIGFSWKSCFSTRNPIFAKKFANIFAMLSAISPWGRGFKSRFLAKSEICRIFHCIAQKLCFSTTPNKLHPRTFFYLLKRWTTFSQLRECIVGTHLALIARVSPQRTLVGPSLGRRPVTCHCCGENGNDHEEEKFHFCSGTNLPTNIQQNFESRRATQNMRHDLQWEEAYVHMYVHYMDGAFSRQKEYFHHRNCIDVCSSWKSNLFNVLETLSFSDSYVKANELFAQFTCMHSRPR
jgi:hypothetical protein